ncbi:MAG TPA: hypothetical protein VM409_04605 [Chloroflexia bacterium]|nr:hypothetical protein [Chloroflexia bacterium]
MTICSRRGSTRPSFQQCLERKKDAGRNGNHKDTKNAKGSRLEQNATYIDLAELEPGEFTAKGDMVAGRKNRHVPKLRSITSCGTGSSAWTTPSAEGRPTRAKALCCQAQQKEGGTTAVLLLFANLDIRL